MFTLVEELEVSVKHVYASFRVFRELGWTGRQLRWSKDVKHVSIAMTTNADSLSHLTRVYTMTRCPATCVSDRTSNLYPDTYMLTDTCCRIQVARSGYMFIHSCHGRLYPFVSSSRRATNWQQFCCRYKTHVDGNKWIQVHGYSLCKRGFTCRCV